MMFAYTKKLFLGNYQTTIFDNYAMTVNMDQKKYTINFFDTAGQVNFLFFINLLKNSFFSFRKIMLT